ncbi:MAG: YnbE family lipoprotein [Pseudomonadota bacterium]
MTQPRTAVTSRLKSGEGARVNGSRGLLPIGGLILAANGLSGCINVAAPEEPIVIELNINIRQEVVYRLAQDAADTVEENTDIF